MLISYLLLVQVSEAQKLVKNINLGPEGSNIKHLQKTPSGVIFTATDHRGSRNLYFTDDSLATPVTLYETGDQIASRFIWAPRSVENKAYFFIYDDGEVSLFLSNLETADLVLLHQWNSVLGISDDLGYFTKVGDRIYFLARFESSEFQIWSTDGSSQGTKFEVALPSNSFPKGFMEVDGRLVFYLSALERDNDLLSYDGSQLELFFPHPARYGFSIFKYNDRVYFNALSDSLGNELFSSDGTKQGTKMVRDINPGIDDSFPREFATFGDTLYFAATSDSFGVELWKTDGSYLGTKLEFDINPGVESSWPYDLNSTQKFLSFMAFDSSYGNELRSINENGELLRITDLGPGTFNSEILDVVSSDKEVYFTAVDSLTGAEIYITDTAGVSYSFLKDVYPGILGSRIRDFTFGDSSMFFVASDDLFGEELWSTQGTVESTALKHDLNTGEDGSFPSNFYKFGDSLFIFRAKNHSTGFEPYISDGSESGTMMLGDLFPGYESSNPQQFIGWDSLIYFLASIATFDQRLVATDGSIEGTQIVTDNRILNSVSKVNDVLVMDVFDPLYGTEPWYFDGDTCRLLKDINPYQNYSSLPSLPRGQVFEDKMYFTANDGIHGYELWQTDGSPEGTILFKDIVVGSGSSNIDYLTCFDSFFLFAGVFHGAQELWYSDGTDSGTYLLKEIQPGNLGSNPSRFISFNGEVFFVASDHRGRELWKTNGTAGGTTIVKDINSSGGSYPSNFKIVGDKLFFSANDGIHGYELWITDGTEHGTKLLSDIYLGNASSSPESLLSIGKALVFSATDSDHGQEVWISDGTEVGTKLVLDIVAGPIGSDPGPYFYLDDRVYFGGEFDVLGQELLMLDDLCLVPYHLTLDDSPLQAGVYRAEYHLSSSAIIDDVDLVEFWAGQEILLSPGFEMESGSILTLIIGIEACDD